jgi:hypothetical protein
MGDLGLMLVVLLRKFLLHIPCNDQEQKEARSEESLGICLARMHILCGRFRCDIEPVLAQKKITTAT